MREGVPSYPVKAFLVFGNNTLSTYGNSRQVYESITNLDLLVVGDLFMTPTVELADFVLPAAAWPELDEIAGLPTIAANVVFAQQKAVQIGECKSDEEIFIELTRKMDLAVGTEDLHDVLDAQLAEGIGITFEELKAKGHVVVPMHYRKYEENGFRTPTGKIELYSTRLEESTNFTKYCTREHDAHPSCKNFRGLEPGTSVLPGSMNNEAISLGL